MLNPDRFYKITIRVLCHGSDFIVCASHVDLGVFPDQYQVWTNVGPLATLVEAHLVLVQYHEWLPHDDL